VDEGSDRSAIVEAGLRLARSTRRGHDVAALSAAGDMLRAGAELADVYDVVTSVVHALSGRRGETAHEDERGAVAVARRVVEEVQPILARSREQDVVMSAPAGEMHTMGIEMVSSAIRYAGYRVTLLRDCPWEQVLEVVAQQPQLVVVGLTDHAGDSLELRHRVRTIREQTDDVAVVLGGYAFTHAQPFARCGADAVLTNARDAVTFVRRVTNPLSLRETEVLQAIADGLETDEIAARLGVRDSTVREHVQRSFNKLSTRNRAAAVAEAIRRGLID
jgi:DNA-binding CsgD family transcriptional regulator/methanogenic corrinoid protein MtbC1